MLCFALKVMVSKIKNEIYVGMFDDWGFLLSIESIYPSWSFSNHGELESSILFRKLELLLLKNILKCILVIF